MGRTDDIINVAGHRLSTGAMEEVLASHPDVAECAVAGVHDPVKGEVPLGFVVLKAGVTKNPDIIRHRAYCPGTAENRPDCIVQGSSGCKTVTQNTIGKDPAGHHKKDRRWCSLYGSGNYR